MSTPLRKFKPKYNTKMATTAIIPTLTSRVKIFFFMFMSYHNCNGSYVVYLINFKASLADIFLLPANAIIKQSENFAFNSF